MKPRIAIILAVVTVSILAIVAGCQTKGGQSRTGSQSPAARDGGSGTKPVEKESEGSSAKPAEKESEGSGSRPTGEGSGTR